VLDENNVVVAATAGGPAAAIANGAAIKPAKPTKTPGRTRSPTADSFRISQI
jgi:hypothetical protein